MIYLIESYLFFMIIQVLLVFLKYIVHHYRENHIDIKHHFIRDHIENENFLLEFVDFENQQGDNFTKHLLEERFCYLIKCLGITSFSTN